MKTFRQLREEWITDIVNKWNRSNTKLYKNPSRFEIIQSAKTGLGTYRAILINNNMYSWGDLPHVHVMEYLNNVEKINVNNALPITGIIKGGSTSIKVSVTVGTTNFKNNLEKQYNTITNNRILKRLFYTISVEEGYSA